MTGLLELDDLAYDLIFSYLRYLDLYYVSLSCRTLRSIVQQSSLKTLNCTRSFDLPIRQLPYPSEHHLYDASDWRELKRKKGTAKEELYMSNLYWTSRHKHFNLSSLTSLFLDGSRVNVLDIIHFVTMAPRLAYLSVRFCEQVNRLLLQNYLDHRSERRQKVNLKRLDVIGIEGIPFFEPADNGTFTFDERELELIGAGPEYDYTDLWRERMYDFKMSLERVPTSHGAKIETDIARCSQLYCRNFNLGFDIDREVELHDFSTIQRWMQIMADDVVRGGQSVRRNCRNDMKSVARDGAKKACLMMQQMHRHLASKEAAEVSLASGWM